MKTVLAFLFALGLVTAELIFGSGCCGETSESRPESDMFAYDVPPELVPAFEAASARIWQASGVVLVMDPSGTAVNLLDDSPQGSCADTYVTSEITRPVVTDVQINLYPAPAGCYQDLGDTLLHELIHSLRRYEDWRNPEDTHSVAGVFTAKAGHPVLEESSLDKICEAVTCTRYNPEE